MSTLAFSRRGFLAGAGMAALHAQPGSGVKIIDAHAHLHHHSNPNWQQLDRKVIDACDKLGIAQICFSILPPERPATPETFRQCNEWAHAATQRFPGRVLPYCFVNPGYREALDEVRRSIDRGFIGVKLYNDYVVTEPVVWPLIELTIQLRVPILHHAGHPSWLDSSQPRISDGAAFAAVAKRYPEAMIICAHLCGGGDWEWEAKALRNAPSVYLDLSGSVVDEGTVEMAAEILGTERLLFACDDSFTASIGRMRSANLAQADKDRIYSLNMQRILSRRGRS